ncbi:MAG TPA: hypothetical protein VM013_04255 [Dehalococcoidia bacterium]|nr:hypothetical protein [Dehalococcoidia bacterium]
MAGASHIPRFRPGAMSLKADHLNAILDAIKTPGGGDGPGSVTGDSWWGIIVATPDGWEEYTDARYWVQPMHCTNDEGDEDSQPEIDVITETEDDPIYGVVTASNLAEVAASTHGLPVGFPVLVRALNDEQQPPITRYVFCIGGAGALFAVRVWRDGPAEGPTEGDHVTKCNLTYAVCTLPSTAPDGTGGKVLGLLMSPMKQRPATGLQACPPVGGAGWVGLACYDETGALTLYDAGEMWGTHYCETETA